MTRYFLSDDNKVDAWVATLGSNVEQVFDPETGKEDFSERFKISAYLDSWRPGQPWIPVPIALHFEAGRSKRQKADNLFFGSYGPIISEHAVNVLRPLLEKEGHVLPLDVVNSDEKFYLWWVPWVENCVDVDNSEWFPSRTSIKKYVLHDDRIEGLIGFRTHYDGMYKPEAQGNVVVNEEFKQAWLDAGLTGIEFKAI